MKYSRLYLLVCLVIYSASFGILQAHISSPLVDHSKNNQNLIENNNKKNSIVFLTQISKLSDDQGTHAIRSQLKEISSMPIQEQKLSEVAPLLGELLPLQLENIKSIIQKIEHLKNFWREQKISIMPYFFGISPKKWISYKDKKVMATLNVRELDYYYEIYTAYLGEIFVRYCEFVDLELEELDLNWSQKTILLLVRSIDPTLNVESIPSIEAINRRAIQLTLEMESIVDNDTKKLFKGKNPSYWERNWLAYSVGAIGLLGGAYAIVENREQIKNGMIKVGQSIKVQADHSYNAFLTILGQIKRNQL